MRVEACIGCRLLVIRSCVAGKRHYAHRMQAPVEARTPREFVTVGTRKPDIAKRDVRRECTGHFQRMLDGRCNTNLVSVECECMAQAFRAVLVILDHQHSSR